MWTRSLVARASMTHFSRMAPKLAKALQLTARPLWRRGLLQGVAATTEHLSLARLVTPDTVIDVGANKGQFSLFALQIWPDCQVIAFEPLPGPAARYRRALGGHPRAKLVEAAIGPTAGMAEIHLSQREDSSSILPIGEHMAGIFPQVRGVGRKVAVKIGPLDHFLAEEALRGKVLLKLDVQGFELEALRGCAQHIESIEHLYVECSYVELYRGQALIGEIECYLRGLGFSLIAEMNTVARAGVGKVQSDCLFRRAAPG